MISIYVIKFVLAMSNTSDVFVFAVGNIFKCHQERDIRCQYDNTSLYYIKDCYVNNLIPYEFYVTFYGNSAENLLGSAGPTNDNSSHAPDNILF